MAIPGRKPTGLPTRDRNPRAHEWVEVEEVPFTGDVPKLPQRKGGWPSRTKRKWAAWSRMPHAKLWGESEWDFAIDSLELAAQFHEGNARVATELRNRERVLGTTADYRRDLRIRYVPPKPEQAAPAEVTNISDYRDL